VSNVYDMTWRRKIPVVMFFKVYLSPIALVLPNIHFSGMRTYCGCLGIFTTCLEFTWFWSLPRKESCTRNCNEWNGLRRKLLQEWVLFTNFLNLWSCPMWGKDHLPRSVILMCPQHKILLHSRTRKSSRDPDECLNCVFCLHVTKI